MSSLRNTALTTALALSATVIGCSAGHALQWTTIANSQTPIPGASGNFSSFNQPSIGESCMVVFRGRGKGPGQPPRGVYFGNPCNAGFSPATSLNKLAGTGDAVPQPNNLDGVFNEFPSIPRIDRTSNFAATRGQHRPVWSYLLPDQTETRIGTAGVYVSLLPKTGDTGGILPPATLSTGASQLGVLPMFSYFDVPGFNGVKFDQFPGSPSPFHGNFVAFKGNFSDGATTRTGVYYRRVTGSSPVGKVADTTDLIPGETVNFGSTAPPSADGTSIVFYGSDNEDAPTVGGIYRYSITTRRLTTLVRIGGPSSTTNTFTRFGEGLSYDGRNVGFWGSWGSRTRTVRLHCPVDGQADVIAECIKQCPDIDAIGNYCERQVPTHQGFFVRLPNGAVRLIAAATPRGPFQDFLFWVFSGAPPRPGSDAEPPRWRSSAFVAISPVGRDVATVFKAQKANGRVGLYIRKWISAPVQAVMLVGSPADRFDPAAPAGALVSSVGVERDGFRNCALTVTASFLNETTSESWAGIYLKKNACR